MWIFRKCLRSEFFSFETVRKWQTYGSGRKPLSVCQHFFIKFLRKLQKFKKIALVFQKYHNLLQNRKGCTDFCLESFWINWGLSESCEGCAVYLVFILHLYWDHHQQGPPQPCSQTEHCCQVVAAKVRNTLHQGIHKDIGYLRNIHCTKAPHWSSNKTHYRISCIGPMWPSQLCNGIKYGADTFVELIPMVQGLWWAQCIWPFCRNWCTIQCTANEHHPHHPMHSYPHQCVAIQLVQGCPSNSHNCQLQEPDYNYLFADAGSQFTIAIKPNIWLWITNCAARVVQAH